MVHLRLNETESNPNPHVNFITALPMPDSQSSEEARQLLRALAAQVRPVMKAHGFSINSFEEYEYNPVFAGRNWNNGETVEIVLRRPNGSYCPTSWLMSTLCHELAHIKHMNHGPAFQALWARLRREVRQLQDKGYYGDGSVSISPKLYLHAHELTGYWSSGTRLADSARMPGDGVATGEFPEYMCGGAQTRTRPQAQRRRRAPSGRRHETTPSLHTGRQTAKKRKAGSRVTSKYAFTGTGNALAETAQSSKGKRAASNRAREARALAAEKRLLALTQKQDLSSSKSLDDGDGSDSDSEIEFVQETDAERRQALLESQTCEPGQDEINLGKGLHWEDFENEFNFSHQPQRSGLPHSDIIELTDSSDNEDPPCDLLTRSGSAFVGAAQLQPRRRTLDGQMVKSSMKPPDKSPSEGTRSGGLSIKNLARNEITFRKKEALGLATAESAQRDRQLGQAPNSSPPPRLDGAGSSAQTPGSSRTWACLICTLENEPQHLACAACGTPKGEDVYHIR